MAKPPSYEDIFGDVSLSLDPSRVGPSRPLPIEDSTTAVAASSSASDSTLPSSSGSSETPSARASAIEDIPSSSLDAQPLSSVIPSVDVSPVENENGSDDAEAASPVGISVEVEPIPHMNCPNTDEPPAPPPPPYELT